MRSDRLLLQDILDAIAVIEQYAPADESRFNADPPLQSHVLRHVQIIGEAVWRLSDGIKSQWAQVPWREIAGMRHATVHGYFNVNWHRVFVTARNDVPVLKPQIEEIVRSLPPEAQP